MVRTVKYEIDCIIFHLKREIENIKSVKGFFWMHGS